MSQKKSNKKPQSYSRFEKHEQGHSLYSHFVWGNELTHLVKFPHLQRCQPSPCQQYFDSPTLKKSGPQKTHG